MAQMKGTSPKRQLNRSEWYPYYAGFSLTFAEDFLGKFAPRGKCLIADPWSGAATTSVAAGRLGKDSVSCEINPAVLIAGRANALLSRGRNPRSTISEQLALMPGRPRIRKIIENPTELIGIRARSFKGWGQALTGVSDDQALLLASVIACVRRLARSRRGSNPTWNNIALRGLLNSFSDAELALQWGETVAFMCSASTFNTARKGTSANFILGSSEELSIEDSSVDCVLTSPPYCTRIDYVIQSRPELEAIGATPKRLRKLREHTTGTPTINAAKVEPVNHDVKLLLGIICKHDSYAAESYYLPFFQQYFASLERSMAEISRIMRKGRYAGIVVQPSTFKDVSIDLPCIVASIAADHKLEIHETQAWAARDFRAVHTGSRRYMPDREIQEHLVVLKKQ
jgi:hypothetical protein